ncbi:MAG: 3-deoxy-7-phosphoheptulonate synthase [Bacteroidales bacterium]|nr:3-deoxy-7-phosphoheptulonate synthase [Bacteroidales bacterium]
MFELFVPMIIRISHQADISFFEKYNKPFYLINWDGYNYLVLSSEIKELSIPDSWYDKIWVFDDDIQLASRKFYSKTREIKIGDYFTTGSDQIILIAGPCSVENEQMIEESAQFIKSLGLASLRAGSYKPRTSPYSFQGLQNHGLKLLAQIKEKYGLCIVTEVRDACHVEEVIWVADVVQVGSKAMYDRSILTQLGKIQKPVLLKRHFGATLQEFVQAAEFILSHGNPNVILCERGIRTFETKTRFTLDLTGVVWLKEHVNLPIILDPSHAMGYAYGVPDLARACLALGVDGLLIEVHPKPEKALSDAKQQLNHEQFSELFVTLKSIAAAIHKKIV